MSSDPTEQSPLLNHRDSTPVAKRFTNFKPSRSSTNTSSSRNSTFSHASDDEALVGSSPEEDLPSHLSHEAILRIILVLLVAVFILNADGSLVLATHPVIASEFNALESSSWLYTGFGLAGAVTQSTLGKLSDIWGRKPLILACYVVFAIGCIIVGMGQSMVAVILGRVLSGSVGAAMNVLISILITDLMPIRDVATWRAYVNVAATTGRTVGGPLGGWLADVVGWRWSFLGQAPFLFFAIILCWRYLPNTLPEVLKGDPTAATTTKRLARVDFLGAFFLGTSILALLLPIEIGGVKVPWNHPLIPILFGIAVIDFAVLILVEKQWAREPILPLELFRNRDAVVPFFIIGLQVPAQIGWLFCVPLYFQVTQKISNTEAGAHLFPAVMGNAAGGVLSGILIKRTGKYKRLVFFSTLSSMACYLILLLRWHGNTNWWESLYIILGGLGTGISQNVLFVACQAAIEPEYIAPAVSMLYLTSGIGAIVGLACMSAATQAVLRKSLEGRLVGLQLSLTEQREIISKAVESVEYVYQIKGKISEAVVASYIDGLWHSYGVSLIFSSLGFVGVFFLREVKL